VNSLKTMPFIANGLCSQLYLFSNDITIFIFEIHDDDDYFTNSRFTDIELTSEMTSLRKMKKYFNGIEYEPINQSGEANE